MTELLEHTLQTVRTLPTEMQDELARMVLLYIGEEQPMIELTPEEEEAVLRSKAEADRGEFATEEEMNAIWAKYDL